MGRKSHAAAKNMEKASPGQCTNPPSDLKESQPESAIPVLRNENTPLRQPGFSADQVASTVERSPVVETDNLNPETQQNVSKSRKKKPKIVNTVVRRSMRVQNAIVTASSLEVEPIVEHVTIDDDPVANDTPPERNFGAMTLEEKLNHALHKLEEQEKVIDTLQSKIIESSGMDEISSAGNVRYRSMYIESQKRVSEHLKEIEALKMENQDLAGKLENALGQIEAFEKQGRTMVEALDKVKDALAISNLIKTIEATVCAAITKATQTALNNLPSLSAAKEQGVSASKRRRDVQENGTD